MHLLLHVPPASAYILKFMSSVRNAAAFYLNSAEHLNSLASDLLFTLNTCCSLAHVVPHLVLAALLLLRVCCRLCFHCCLYLLPYGQQTLLL
jgi:hypothetical protein